MRFLCFFCMLSLLLGGVTRAQRGNPIPEEFQKKLTKAPDDSVGKAHVDANHYLKVYPLKYTNAPLAMTTLQTLGPACQIAADTRQNAIVIKANKEDHAKISELLQLIDVPGNEEDATSIVRANAKEVGASGPIVSKFADMLDVNVAIDQETGLFMIKGPKKDVQRVTDIIDQIKAASREKIANDAKVSSKSYALRVLWLSNEPLPANTEPTLIDSKLLFNGLVSLDLQT
jgi:type II secretory pathway component GspD/PulD (secretin)